VVDDPHSVDQAESDAERQNAIEWWNGSMATRLNDFRKGHKVVIQQRLHEADLTGDLLGRAGYELLCLPAEFEPDRRCSTSIGWTDPRTDMGELLWPEKVNQVDLENLKQTLGSYRYAGQYQQRPAPASGGMLKQHWWRYWQPRGANLGPVSVKMPDGSVEQRMPVNLPEKFDVILQSWDMAFKRYEKSRLRGRPGARRRRGRPLHPRQRACSHGFTGNTSGGASVERALAERSYEISGGQSQWPGGDPVVAA